MALKIPYVIGHPESQLDRIEKKLDAIIAKFEIQLGDDDSHDNVAERKILVEYHQAACKEHALVDRIRDIFRTQSIMHLPRVGVTVHKPLKLGNGDNPFDAEKNETNTFLVEFEFDDQYNPVIIHTQPYPLKESSVSYRGSVSGTGNIFKMFAKAILKREIDIPEAYVSLNIEMSDKPGTYAKFDISECVARRDDFFEWWNGFPIDVTEDGRINGCSGCIELLQNVPFTDTTDPKNSYTLRAGSWELYIGRVNEMITDARIGHVEFTHVDHKELGQFIYRGIVMDEFTVPNFNLWRRDKYSLEPIQGEPDNG